MIDNWRIYIIIILMTMSVVDLALTYHYVSKYKKWQPEKPYKLIENNPLLVFLWNTFGLHLGMAIGSIIILSLIYIISKSAHPIVIGILFLIMCYALHNHYVNINLLGSLIEKYPNGHLPLKTFGEVIGNNSK